MLLSRQQVTTAVALSYLDNLPARAVGLAHFVGLVCGAGRRARHASSSLSGMVGGRKRRASEPG